MNELYGAYNSVHSDLVALSKLLHDQIEALKLAIHSAHNGYVDTDLDQRDKMWAVQSELMKYYVPPKGSPVAQQNSDHTADKPGSNKVTW